MVPISSWLISGLVWGMGPPGTLVFVAECQRSSPLAYPSHSTEWRPSLLWSSWDFPEKEKRYLTEVLLVSLLLQVTKPLILAASSLILTFSFYFFFLVIFFNPKSLLYNPIYSLLNNRSYLLVTKITSLSPIFPDHFQNIFKLSITWITYIPHYFLNYSQTTHTHILLMG